MRLIKFSLVAALLSAGAVLGSAAAAQGESPRVEVQVVPLTGSVSKLYPSESYVTFRGKKAKAMADQLTTVSKKRLINPAGSISSTEMERIGQAITIQLDF